MSQTIALQIWGKRGEITHNSPPNAKHHLGIFPFSNFYLIFCRLFRYIYIFCMLPIVILSLFDQMTRYDHSELSIIHSLSLSFALPLQIKTVG